MAQNRLDYFIRNVQPKEIAREAAAERVLSTPLCRCIEPELMGHATTIIMMITMTTAENTRNMSNAREMQYSALFWAFHLRKTVADPALTLPNRLA